MSFIKENLFKGIVGIIKNSIQKDSVVIDQYNILNRFCQKNIK